MTDRIKMYCLKKCETCEGKGEFLEEESWDISAKELVKCDRCKGKGYTDSVMVFEWDEPQFTWFSKMNKLFYHLQIDFYGKF